MENRRTTVVLDAHLYRQAKRAAVERDKSLKEIIDEALRTFLREGRAPIGRVGGPDFGVYPGKLRTNLRRETIYRNLRK